MAWRDTRASRRRLFASSLCVAFGVAALVGLGSLSRSVEASLRAEAKGLLGADLVLTAREPFPPALERRLEALGGGLARDVSFTSMIAFPGSGGAVRLVQVRAMDGRFPFYGDFATDPPAAAARLRAGSAAAILEPALLVEYGVRPGDKVRLGRATFSVAGALEKLPGESLAIDLLAPRVLIPLSRLPSTGLLGPGSLVRYRAALELPPGADPDALGRRLQGEFPAAHLGFETAASRARQIGRTIGDLYGFLSLAGFVALALGAIGAASAVQLHVSRKVPTIAILRCLGADAAAALAVYLAQGLALGLAGAAAGAAGGLALQAGLPALARPWLPFPVEFRVFWPAVARGMAVGFAVGSLFTLLPLLAVRRVPPLAALRPDAAEPRRRRDPWVSGVGIAIAAALAGLAVAETRSLRLGLGFAGMLAAGFGALAALARLLAWGARRWPPRAAPYVVRQGVANLHRPGNRTTLLLVALGLGTFLMLTLVLVRATLLGEIDAAGAGDRPNLVFFDLQDDQIGPFDRLAAEEGIPVVSQAPLVSMRIASVGGRTPDALLAGGGRRVPAWTLRREYRSTYRDRLSDGERIVAGAFVGRAGPAQALVPVSVEEGLARDLRLRLGEEIDWNVQGVLVRTRVASLRAVEWRRLEPNFFVVFPDGALDGAPETFLAALRAATPAASARIQRAAAAAFPNASAIDLALLRRTIDGLLAKIEFGVQAMALFTAAAGLAVLGGAAWGGRAQRVREAALLRALGATGRQLAAIQAAEYAALGLLAAAIGAALAAAANALLARFLFGTAAAFPPGPPLAAAGAAVAVTLAAGWLADRGVARLPPLETLRREG